jgi:hypothetical protein
MDDSKNPPEASYGSRLIVTNNYSDGSQKTFVDLKSVLDTKNNVLNGHINRNIRVQLAMIDSAKPYI